MQTEEKNNAKKKSKRKKNRNGRAFINLTT